MISKLPRVLLTFCLAACSDDQVSNDENEGGTAGVSSDGGSGAVETGGGGAPSTAGETATGGSAAGSGSSSELCALDDGSITLPPGFCAVVVADELGKARHLTVTPEGDLYVAIANSPDGKVKGGIFALRDSDGDGEPEDSQRFHDNGGNGIAWAAGRLYLAENERVVYWELDEGQLVPTGAPEVLIEKLPFEGDHYTKTIVVEESGNLLLALGSATNSCQGQNRVPGAPGLNPCPELVNRAGIWRFSTTVNGQTFADGVQVATGLRNIVALATEPTTGELFGAVNGRDQLFDNFPDLFTEVDDALAPSEEVVRIEEGGDYGWPYCYHDPRKGLKVLAPEYGGDGSLVGQCASAIAPVITLPAHWAPLSMHFYRGKQFPTKYRGGAFVANHGSLFSPDASAGNAPGYNVAFIPFEADVPAANWQVFADDFAGEARPLPDAAEFRPVGLAEAPDGSLYLSEDKRGRVWRIFYAP